MRPTGIRMGLPMPNAPVIKTATIARLARKYTEANMIARVRVARMAAPTEGDELDWSNTATQLRVTYEGRARIWSVAGAGANDYGDEMTAFSSSYVSLPLTVDDEATDVQVDDIVLVLEHPDPAVVGRAFRVMDVDAGGQFPAARRLQVTGVQRSRNWEFV